MLSLTIEPRQRGVRLRGDRQPMLQRENIRMLLADAGKTLEEVPAGLIA